MVVLMFVLESSMTRIVLFENIHSSASEVLEAAGFTDVTTHSSSLPPRELRQALHGANLIGIRSRTNLTAEILSGLPDLRAVGCFCIGTNHADLDKALSQGTPVFNEPYSNTRRQEETTSEL